jgi:transposase-like protein
MVRARYRHRTGIEGKLRDVSEDCQTHAVIGMAAPVTPEATNKSWRIDETYIRVKGKWTYLDRAVDSAGASIDFLLSAQRDAEVRRHVAASMSTEASAIP